ncbi:MAG TPA: hypothetical protein VFW65_03760 [Pseudonocardiaceae bacterium]|nr:hypothetical protein [Pseudonocardiaceae bacterium]
MPTLDEAWSWCAEPADKLRAGVLSRPHEQWDTRREVLRTELSSATSDPLAEKLVTWLDEMSASDRDTLLGTDELPNHIYAWLTRQLPSDTADNSVATTPAYDETAWYAHLAENGTRWDGTEPSWGAFREWFLYYAGDAGFGTPATQLLDYLQPMPAADRVTTLAQYGVHIQAPAPAPVVAQPDAELRQRIDATIARVLARNPELAGIPEDRRLELAMAIITREGSSK